MELNHASATGYQERATGTGTSLDPIPLAEMLLSQTFTGTSNFGKVKKHKTNAEIIQFLTQYITKNGAMTMSGLVNQMLLETNSSEVDLWEDIYANPSFNQLVTKAFNLVKISAGDWTFNQVIQGSVEKNWNGTRSLQNTAQLFLRWLNFHHIYYTNYRTNLIAILNKSCTTSVWRE